MKKLIALMLAMVMVLSFAACSSEGTAQTTAPTEITVPPTTTEPEPDAAELYRQAARAVEAASSLLVTYTIEKEMTLGADTYLETEEVTVSLLNPGSEEFLAQATRDFAWDDLYYADVTEFWGEGSFYSSVASSNRTAEMTQEAFVQRYLPAVLLDPGLYTSVEFTDADTVSFTGATGLEAWLADDRLTLVEASGTADLTSEGVLGECTYQVVYTQSGVEHRMEVSLHPQISAVSPALPDHPDQFASVESPDAIIAYERLLGLLLQTTDYSTAINNTTVVSAGGVALSEVISIDLYGTGKDLAAEYEYASTVMDLYDSSELDSYNVVETFKNSTYTYSENGGTEIPDRTVNASLVESWLLNDLSSNILLNSAVDTMKFTDLGAVSLLEFTLTEEICESYTTDLVGVLFENANILNELASGYRTELCDYYIGIDNATGLPTLLGIEYLGWHTIDGEEYGLALEQNQTFSFGTGAGYEVVMGEALPIAEPEEKASPLLYHVTGQNGEEMWLFGTIHVGDERMAYLPEYVTRAFAASDALAVEFDAGESDALMEEDPEYAARMLSYYVYTDGSTAQEHLSDEELYQHTIQLLKATGNYHSTVPMLKPVVLGNLIENAYLDLARQLNSDFGADNQLMDMAREAGKKILSVESAEEQTAMLTGYSDALQELLLAETIGYSAVEYQANILELYEMWCRGNEAELIEYLSVSDDDLAELTEEELALYEEYTYAMSTERNAGMLEVAKGYLESGDVVFYAVGLAHLLEADGLVNTLREAGYTVELVSIN